MWLVTNASPAPGALLDTLAQEYRTSQVRLYGQVAAHHEQNLVLSTYALQTAVGMLQRAAHGKTAEELAQAMGMHMPVDAHDEAVAQLITHLSNSGPHHAVILQQATRLWIDQKFEVYAAFQDSMKKVFGSEVARVDIASHAEEARTQINRWIADHTQQLIPTLLPPGCITSLSRLVQTAALYFKAPWARPMEKLPSRVPFYGVHGTHSVDMMRSPAERWRVRDDKDMVAVEIPYDGSFALLLVMPRGALRTFEATFDPGALRDDTLEWTRRQVVVQLPSFHVETSTDAAVVLRALGAVTAFAAEADFSAISRVPLMLSSFVTKAVITVDRYGTEAAAATAAVASMRSVRLEQPLLLTLDHPFLFFVWDTEHHVVLFSGRVSDLP